MRQKTFALSALMAAFATAAATIAPFSLAAQDSASSNATQADSTSVLIRQAETEGRVSIEEKDRIRRGDITIAETDTIVGDLVTFRGNIDLSGTVTGDVVALRGNILIRPTARIGGSAVAVAGTITNEGGTVAKEAVELGLTSTSELGLLRHGHPLALAAGWALVLAVIGVAVLLLAKRNLERVAEAVGEKFGLALIYGVLAQLAFFPVLLLMIVALAITIIGLLLIPIAIVVYVTAAIGAAALGFLAVAYASGESIDRAVLKRKRAIPLLSMLLGIAVYFGTWIIAGSLEWAGIVGSVIRAVVLLATWVALSAGFGATIMTRGGSRDLVSDLVEKLPPPDDSWQTPTPVGGVTAARRPTPVPRSYNR